MLYSNRRDVLSLCVTAGRRCPSRWRPERLLDVVGKGVHYGAFIVTLV